MSGQNPTQILREFLQGDTVTSGTFISYDGQSALVSTKRGAHLYPLATAVALNPGDQVSLRNGAVTNKMKPDGSIPRFTV